MPENKKDITKHSATLNSYVYRTSFQFNKIHNTYFVLWCKEYRITAKIFAISLVWPETR